MSPIIQRMSRLGLVAKYDPLMASLIEDYDKKWETILDELEKFGTDLPPKKQRFSIATVGSPHEFYDLWSFWHDFVNKLTIDTNVEESFAYKFREILSKKQSLALSNAEMSKSYEPFSVFQNVDAAQKLSASMYVTDIDWEDTLRGAFAFIYGRNACLRDETMLLLVEMCDYFYIELGPHVNCDIKLAKSAINNAALRLARQYENAAKKMASSRPQQSPPIGKKHNLRQGGHLLSRIRTGLVTRFEVVQDHKSVYGFQRSNGLFLKVFTMSPTVTKDLFHILTSQNPTWRLYEATLDPMIKFMSKWKISGNIIIDFDGVLSLNNHLSYCDALITRVTSIRPSETHDSSVCKPLHMFFDIECLAVGDIAFPHHDTCPVIQISYLLSWGSQEIVDRGVLCLYETCYSKQTLEAAGDDELAQLISFDTESQMLLSFAQIIHKHKPDNLIGYNSNWFDVPYILGRMDALNIPFCKEWSRRRAVHVTFETRSVSTNQRGDIVQNEYDAPGITFYDQLIVLRAENVTLQLSSFKLKDVCSHFLKGNQNKRDLKISELPNLFKTPEGRGVIADYCMQDSMVLLHLERIVSMYAKNEGMARVVGSTVRLVIGRGLVFRVMSKVKQYTEKYNLLLPSFAANQVSRKEGSYKGAHVVSPTTGLHRDVIGVWDAASLYPSVMRCDNLSWDTYCVDVEDLRAHPNDYVTFESGSFVKKSVHEGILCKMQADLARERKNARTLQKQYQKGSDAYNVCETTQLAIKITMNSCYGMLGASTATIPLRPVARTITLRGEFMLMMFKDFILKHFQTVTQEAMAPEIIYGDSVGGDQTVVVRINGVIRVLQIEDLVLFTDQRQYMPARFLGDKEVVSLDNQNTVIEAWTEQGWTRVRSIIRHRHNGPLVRVRTANSEVVVTRDHSLVEASSGAAILPAQIEVDNTQLMHSSFARMKDYEESHTRLFRRYPRFIIIERLADTQFPTIESVKLAAHMLNCFVDSDDLLSLCCLGQYGEAIVESPETNLTLCVRDDYAGRVLLLLQHTYPDLHWQVIEGPEGLRLKFGAQYMRIDHDSADTENQHQYLFLQATQQTLQLVEIWREAIICPRTSQRMVHPYLFLHLELTLVSHYVHIVYEYNVDTILPDTILQALIVMRASNFEYERSALIEADESIQMTTVTAIEEFKSRDLLCDSRGMVNWVYDLSCDNQHFQAGLGCQIVHNTDSIFVKMPGVSIKRGIEIGALIEKAFSEQCLDGMDPHKFEYEKCFYPFLILAKKKYIGRKFETDPNKSQVASKGIELSRRDTSPVCRLAMETLVEKVMAEDDLVGGIKHVVDTIQSLLLGEFPLEMFKLKKQLRTTKYINKPAHIIAWEAMKRRKTAFNAPGLGDYFEYVIVLTQSKSNAGKKIKHDACIDYELMEENQENYQIDYHYYLSNTMKEPLLRLLTYMVSAEVCEHIFNINRYKRLVPLSSTAQDTQHLDFVIEMEGAKHVITPKNYEKDYQWFLDINNLQQKQTQTKLSFGSSASTIKIKTETSKITNSKQEPAKKRKFKQMNLGATFFKPKSSNKI